MFLSIGMLKQKYFLTDIFILSAEKQPIKLSWRKIEWLQENNVTLDGVTITGSSFIQKKDCLLIIPSKLQSKYAYNGYDLLYNLMIPGVVVNRKEGAVITSRGSATLYINGVKADFHKIQNLRPKDIDKEFAL